MNKPLNMELHHINGDHIDLRIENLQMLCPNCHALTENKIQIIIEVKQRALRIKILM